MTHEPTPAQDDLLVNLLEREEQNRPGGFPGRSYVRAGAMRRGLVARVGAPGSLCSLTLTPAGRERAEFVRAARRAT